MGTRSQIRPRMNVGTRVLVTCGPLCVFHLVVSAVSCTRLRCINRNVSSGSTLYGSRRNVSCPQSFRNVYVVGVCLVRARHVFLRGKCKMENSGNEEAGFIRGERSMRQAPCERNKTGLEISFNSKRNSSTRTSHQFSRMKYRLPCPSSPR